MIFHDEFNKALVITDIHDQVRSNNIWVLDLKQLDFRLYAMRVLEEMTAPSITFKINGRLLCMPCHWQIMICDPETSQIDLISVSELSNGFYKALVVCNDMKQPMYEPITVIEYHLSEHHVYPTHSRHIMLCHDVGEGKWINCSYTDSFNRFLKNKFLGDILDY